MSNVTGDAQKWGGGGGRHGVSLGPRWSASDRYGILCILLPRGSVTVVLRFSKSMRRALERLSEETLVVKQTTKLVLRDNETGFSEMPVAKEI
jgi:hypothetical protein